MNRIRTKPLCDYPKDLIKYTPASHPDHAMLTDALNMTQHFLDEFNIIQTKSMFPVSLILNHTPFSALKIAPARNLSKIDTTANWFSACAVTKNQNFFAAHKNLEFIFNLVSRPK